MNHDRDPEAEERERDIQRDTHIAGRTLNPGSMDPAPEDADDQPGCRAGWYASVPDTYLGSALCGCENCREYVAERESEDEV